MLTRALIRMTPKTWLGRYMVAIGSVSIVITLRLVLNPIVGDEFPFLLLFTAVLLSAGFGGLGPGLLATFIGAIATILLLINPNHTLWIDDRTELLAVLRFAIEGFLISILGAGLDSARRRAMQSEAETRRLEQRLLDISDDERRRIGQDLHDGLGQHLTGVAFLTKALQQRLTSKALPESEEATKIAGLVSESIVQTRALARGLAPVGLEGGGLAASLTQLATSTSTVFGVRCVFRGDSSIELNDLGLATHLYRIAQEAITNAVRHGKAKRIDVDLDRLDASFQLSIEDDGVGITPGLPNGGMGLQIMQFRAKMLNGSLEILRRNSQGTRIACVVPIQGGERKVP